MGEQSLLKSNLTLLCWKQKEQFTLIYFWRAKKKRKLISPNFTLLKSARLLCSLPSNPPCLQQVNALGWGTPHYTHSSTPEVTGKLNFGKTTLLLQGLMRVSEVTDASLNQGDLLCAGAEAQKTKSSQANFSCFSGLPSPQL